MKLNELDINDPRRLLMLGDDAEHALIALAENVTVGFGIYKITEKGAEMEYLSKQCLGMIGFTIEQYCEEGNDLIKRIPEEDMNRINIQVRSAVANEYPFDSIFRFRKPDDSIIWVRIKSIPVNHNEEGLYVATIEDITVIMEQYDTLNELKNITEKFKLQKQRYRMLSESVDAVMFQYEIEEDVLIMDYNIDDNHDRKIINEFVKNLDKRYVIHRKFINPCLDKIKEASNKYINDEVECVTDMTGSGYGWKRVKYCSVMKKDGSILGITGRVYNIDEEVRRFTEYDEMVFDKLTGAYEKNCGLSLMDEYVNKKNNVYVVDFDIKDFKAVNNQYGRNTGDRILREYIQNIIGMINDDELVIRYKGDEFFIVLLRDEEKEVAELIDDIRKNNIVKIGSDIIGLECEYGYAKSESTNMMEVMTKARGNRLDKAEKA